jgi:hypothetical protein
MKIFFLSLVTLWAAHRTEPLSPAKVAALKTKPCAFLHVWAIWCTPCVQEMPEVLKFLSQQKEVTPVVIDVSTPFQQDNWTRNWMDHLNPPFTTYVRPKGKEDVFLSAIDSDWSGALPFSALYDQGKKKKTWVGTLDLSKLKQDLSLLCRHAG